ncbi:MAG: N-acetylmuramoyl-L-alanine amidase [Lachnospiraceae bacterium]|nr:N-acetylmuramoyl-L-alanine amidase [Lachnospiraceae bacterium]
MKRIVWFLLVIGVIFLFMGCSVKKSEQSLQKEETKVATTEKKKNTQTEITTETAKEKYLVAIDAGHQEHQNSDTEPIGPGASEQKMKVASGTQGIKTGNPEYVINLEVSKKLRDILENRGYEVLMIRESNDVDISNRERAEIANNAQADIFLRIHCNSAEDSSTNGALALCPDSKNPYCSEKMKKASSELSEIVLKNLCEKTGAKQLSMIRTSTMSGINWSEIPVSIIEMGFMSNPDEDQKLGDDVYQTQLAEGIADGVDQYFEEIE